MVTSTTYKGRPMLRHALRFALLGAATLTTPALAADWVVIDKQTTLDAPADAAWAVLGDYCSIGVWFAMKCEITSPGPGPGGDRSIGTVRILNGEIEEVIVGTTALSHTYVQTKGSMDTTGYHGTVSLSPNTDDGQGGATSTLRWVGIYDQSALPDDEARAAANARLNGAYETGVANMKALVESAE